MLTTARMSEYFEIANVQDLAVGDKKMILIGDRRIAIYRTAKGIFATDNSCPHRGGPLAEGDLMGDEIVCPWHLWNFNVETGATSITAELCLVTHEVKIEGEKILVRLSPLPPPLDDFS